MIVSRREFKIFLTFFLIYSLFIHWVGWNEESRLALIKAIVEEGRLEIDYFANQTGDRAFFNGHYYTDKPPGASFLVAPVYTIWKFVYSFFQKDSTQTYPSLANHISEKVALTTIYTSIDPGFFTLTSMILIVIFSSSLFGALSVVLVYKALSFFQSDERAKLLLTFAFGLGTLIFPSSLIFFGNVIATFLGFLSFYLIFKNRKNPSYYLLGGSLLGFSVTVEYTMAIVMSSCLVLTFFYSRKHLKWFLLGSFIGVTLLLAYNFSIFKNLFELTMYHMDRSVWPVGKVGKILEVIGVEFSWPEKVSLKTILIYRFIRTMFVLPFILFLPFRGLFFYYPVFFFSLIGLWYMFKKYKLETLTILFLLVSFTLFNSIYLYWWGGSSFGPRYLLPIVPFLILPLSFGLEKIKKNKVLLLLFIFFLTISIFHNVIGIQEFEGPVLEFDFVTNQYKISKIILNPLYEHYLPLFLKNGPRSRIFEGLFYSPYKIDIRDFKPMPVREIKLFTFVPFGILVLKIPFLIIPVLLLIVTLIWSEELFTIFAFKKISIGLLLSILIVLLFLSRLEFKDIVYDKNWYPIHVNATHEINERWMTQEASIFFYSPKEEKANLVLRIGTFYKPRQLSIEVNGKTSKYFVASSNETLITYSVPLKKGENKINLKSLSGCDKPALLINGSSDYRCLSFIVFNISTISLPEYKIVFGKNWYPLEQSIRWAYENPTIFFYSTQKAKVKLNLTLASYYKAREIDFYFNGFLFDTLRVEPYKINILTKTLPLKEGENVVEFISKEKCDVPAIIEKSNDKRCLSFGLFDINLISPYELKDNKTFFGPNWYEQEKDGRWMSNNASIFLFSEKEKEVSLILELVSYYKLRAISLYLNKALILSQSIPTYKIEITIQKLKLLEGENLIEFKSSESCDIPYVIEKTEDKRCLSFKLLNLKII